MRSPASVLLSLALLATAASASAQPNSEKVSVADDLLVVITLQGKPCGKVTSHEQKGEDDYLVTCQTGHHYRVYINQNQRVVVEEK
jgi:hypothetical protein